MSLRPETPVFMACCLLPFELREGRFSPPRSVDIKLAVSRTLRTAGAGPIQTIYCIVIDLGSVFGTYWARSARDNA